MQRRSPALGALTMRGATILLSLALCGCAGLGPASDPSPEPAAVASDADSGRSHPGVERIEIPSSVDQSLQKAYAYQSRSPDPQPLIVRLHAWSADYQHDDPMRKLVVSADYHYIYPDFRGPNNRPESCASPLALADIDDAISYCLDNFNVDPERIYIVGGSGGGHATCAAYLNSKHAIRAFHAWVPITDIEAWYHQTKQRGLKYAQDIEQILGGPPEFHREAARSRSPLHMPLSPRDGKIHIYAGIEDGYTGSVPISHSILFFNRHCDAHGRPELRLSEEETIALLTKSATEAIGEIGQRSVYFERDSEFARLAIFEGGHEVLYPYAFDVIRGDIEDGGDEPGRNDDS